jgi:hypothetical protein
LQSLKDKYRGQRSSSGEEYVDEKRKKKENNGKIDRRSVKCMKKGGNTKAKMYLHKE